MPTDRELACEHTIYLPDCFGCALKALSKAERKLREFEDSRFDRMDALDETTGGRSVEEVCESERSLRTHLTSHQVALEAAVREREEAKLKLASAERIVFERTYAVAMGRQPDWQHAYEQLSLCLSEIRAVAHNPTSHPAAQGQAKDKSE